MDPEAPPELIGCWRVVRYVDRDDPEGPWVSSVPDDATGFLTYDAAGLRAAQLRVPASADRPADHWAYFGFGLVHDLTRHLTADGEVLRGVARIVVDSATDPALAEYADRPIEVVGDRLLVGDQVTWLREFARLA